MRHALLGLVALLSLGCRPDPPKTTERVWSIDVRSLHNSYRDQSQRWTGQHVRVVLIKDSWVKVGSEIHWHAGRTTEPPSVVVECHSLPQYELSTVEVTAFCCGAVEDGKLRANGTQFHVLLRAYAVTQVR